MPITGTFTGSGDSPSVSSAIALSSTKVRVTFSEGMTNNSVFQNVSSYVITPAIGSNAVSVTAVTPEAVTNPTYVDLTLGSNLTAGTNNYTITVSGTLEDAAGNTIDPSGLSDQFDGVGVASASTTSVTTSPVPTIFSDTSRQISRKELLDRMTIDGRPFIVRLVQNPIIDDIVISEARAVASEISSRQENTSRRVDRSLRDYLIRLSVER